MTPQRDVIKPACDICQLPYSVLTHFSVCRRAASCCVLSCCESVCILRHDNMITLPCDCQDISLLNHPRRFTVLSHIMQAITMLTYFFVWLIALLAVDASHSNQFFCGHSGTVSKFLSMEKLLKIRGGMQVK